MLTEVKLWACGSSVLYNQNLPTETVPKLFSNKIGLCLLSKQSGPAIAELLNTLNTKEKQI
jgi:hypothetical protein